jgi:hypothetical protein
MRLRDRRHRQTFHTARAFRAFVDPDKRRNSRWRGKLVALRRLPAEPYEVSWGEYWSIGFDGAPHVIGRCAVTP